MRDEAEIIKALDNKITHLTPVQWAEENRVLTSDITNWPGKMSYDRTPYLKEIANSIMANDEGQVFAIMKGSQIGFSIGGIFTMMGWVIAESPANMLFMVSDEEGVRRAMQGPIDQMINSSGLEHLIRASNTRGGRNQKTGDTVKGKQFPNGNLYTWSGKAIGNLSQISAKYTFADEFERYPKGDKNAGSLVSLIEERAKSFADTRKMYFISTPEIKQTSNIEPIYLKGDQRKYHIPCPHCGSMIWLMWHSNVEHLQGAVGVVFERTELGELKPDTVKYRCQECGDKFDQTYLYECYDENSAEWIPTAKPASPKYRSYHLSALYAPPGMYNWKHYAQKWCEIHPVNGDTETQELQTFINQCLGETWEALASEVEIKNLLKNTRSYDIGVVPNALSELDGNGKIVMLTCAIDLNGKEDDARLDYEVLAWSETGTSYSVEHGSIGTFERSKTVRSGQAGKYKKQDEDRVKWTYRSKHKNNVWDEYEKEVMNKVFITDDGSRKMQVFMHGVDTGHFTIHAYSFCEAHTNCLKLKGKVDNKFTKHDANKFYYQKSAKINNLYLVDGDVVKTDLHGLIQLRWTEDMETGQPEGFMNFPKPDGKHYMLKGYFNHFEGEKMEPEMNPSGTAIGYRWVKVHSSSQNHFWDCRCYNMVVKEIITEMICKEVKVPVSWVNCVQLIK